MNYKTKELISEEQKSQEEILYAVESQKLQYQSDLLATQKYLTETKKNLEIAKTEYPLDFEKIVGLTNSVEAFEKGYVITGTDEDVPNTFVYHAGTKLNDAGQLVTNGGRVLTVVGLADDLPTARERAYARVAGIHFEKEHHRNDIGDKSLKRGK